MKNGKKSFVSILVFGIVVLSLLIVPVSAAKLATPVPVSPANNQHFYGSYGIVTGAWKPVPNATQYYIETQQKLGVSWIPAGFADTIREYCRWDTLNLTDTYRWRIIAVAPGFTNSTPSAWRTFDYNMGQTQLATPILVSPKSGTNFYHTPRDMTLSWKPVLGADRYDVGLEFYDPIAKAWISLPSYSIKGSQNAGCSPIFNGPYQGRWCVNATDTTGGWQASKSSAWSYFTFKV